MSLRHTAWIAAAIALPTIVATAQDSGSRPRQPLPRRSEQTQATSRPESAERAVRESDRQLAEQLGWEVAATDEGLRIERIVTNSPIARAHLQEHDLIVKVGGERVETQERLSTIVRDLRNADEQQTDIVVLRDGKELSYLLPLDTIEPGEETTETRTATSDHALEQMIQQLQAQNQRQEELLQTVLLELQKLQLQLSGRPTANGAAVGTSVRDIAPPTPVQPAVPR